MFISTTIIANIKLRIFIHFKSNFGIIPISSYSYNKQREKENHSIIYIQIQKPKSRKMRINIKKTYEINLVSGVTTPASIEYNKYGSFCIYKSFYQSTNNIHIQFTK